MMESRPTIYLMCGLAFSGKSTLAARVAERIDACVVSLDQINASRGLHGGLGIPTEEWARSHRQALEQTEHLLHAGRSVIVDDTNCYRWMREDYRQVAARCGGVSAIIYMDVPVELAMERTRTNQRTRERHPVKVEILADLADHFEKPGADENVLVFHRDDSIDSWLSAHFRTSMEDSE